MASNKMRFIFLIQGEGRGHMTQSIALFRMLKAAGHEVAHVFIGKNPHRQVPAFVYEQLQAPVEEIESPNFVYDKKSKGINIFKTITKNLGELPKFLKSLRVMRDRIREVEPDAIINFYDFLGGIYHMRYGVKYPLICIGHQYLAHHPDFPFVPGKPLAKWLFQLNNWITSYGASKLLALSFQPYPPHQHPGLKVVPPLLREEVLQLKPGKSDFFLIYILNQGYAEELKAWHSEHPEIPLHCFWDNREAPEVLEVDSTLHFHRLNAEKFLDKMSQCRAFFSTAGFESICEAMYLDKPVMMVPVAGHYEQQCNALDAQKAGAGIAATRFDLSAMIEHLPGHQSSNDTFKPWAEGAAQAFLELLTNPELDQK